ncbi:hydrogenase-1 operon protein HyaD [Salmonella enterica subsp. enterica]|uniref:Hydrogenase-1 operon protein HyaD n=1 Tax=Salmonella enterica I TaxID=59201 RepID=A0A3S4FQL0_SALET|nr:hydrogenase-1 operon protein HyaD [Salmonella enterica subsp. enterica]
MDGGTQGLNLLGYVEQASHLLLLDAIDYGLAPGSLRTYAGEKNPRVSQRQKNEPCIKTVFPKFWRWPTSAGICPVTLRWSACNRALLDDYGGSLSEIARGQLPAAEQARPGATGRLGDSYRRQTRSHAA